MKIKSDITQTQIQNLATQGKKSVAADIVAVVAQGWDEDEQMHGTMLAFEHKDGLPVTNNQIGEVLTLLLCAGSTIINRDQVHIEVRANEGDEVLFDSRKVGEGGYGVNEL